MPTGIFPLAPITVIRRPNRGRTGTEIKLRIRLIKLESKKLGKIRKKSGGNGIIRLDWALGRC